jgi:hypothetical protein
VKELFSRNLDDWRAEKQAKLEGPEVHHRVDKAE